MRYETNRSMQQQTDFAAMLSILFTAILGRSSQGITNIYIYNIPVLVQPYCWPQVLTAQLKDKSQLLVE